MDAPLLLRRAALRNREEGTGTIVKITSLLDGYFQYLDEKTIQEWQMSSAYFNGDLLLVELIAHPGTGPNRLVVNGLDIGMLEPGEDTQCGPEDNRVPSNDPRAGRLMPIGCTGFIINDACGCLITAGHCLGGSVMQFNVPLSNGNGSTNNPPPSEQYAVDTSSKQGTGSGIGNDWGYFGCFPNSTTGLTPRQAQGASYVWSDPPPPWAAGKQVRITGYGTDTGTANQTQQTHAGPWLSWSGGNALDYQADTQGGNSGSPVIQEEAGVVMGVHTHGGCSTSGSGANHGTASVRSTFRAALANPKGVCLKTGPPTCATSPFVAVRNGSGLNPLCLSSSSVPAVGTTWEYVVDPSVVPGGNASIVRAKQPGAGVLTGIGELLIDPNSRTSFVTVRSGPGPHVHSINIPATLELVGFTGSLQAVVSTGGEPITLCNALDFLVGCAQPTE